MQLQNENPQNENLADLEKQYRKKLLKSLSGSRDIGYHTIYTFDRYCKRCGEGLIQAFKNIRMPKRLWRSRYCSDDCKSLGPRKVGQYIRVRQSKNRNKNNLTEDAALLAYKIQRIKDSLPPLIRLAKDANDKFNLLNEKLGFLEVETGERWSKSKFYYWLNKA